MTSTIDVAAPHNWCDRRCERCPLATTCPVPGLADRELEEILEESLAVLETMSGEMGIDISEAPTPPPESLETSLLREAGIGWAHAFMALEPSIADAVVSAAALSGKVTRIAFAVDVGDDEFWSRDTVPNLLVVEKMLDAARLDVARVRGELAAKVLVRFNEADARLRALLSPLLEAISRHDRAAFAALAAAGQAPSPLATRLPRREG